MVHTFFVHGLFHAAMWLLLKAIKNSTHDKFRRPTDDTLPSIDTPTRTSSASTASSIHLKDMDSKNKTIWIFHSMELCTDDVVFDVTLGPSSIKI